MWQHALQFFGNTSISFPPVSDFSRVSPAVPGARSPLPPPLPAPGSLSENCQPLVDLLYTWYHDGTQKERAQGFTPAPILAPAEPKPPATSTAIPRPTQQNLCYFVAFSGLRKKQGGVRPLNPSLTRPALGLLPAAGRLRSSRNKIMVLFRSAAASSYPWPFENNIHQARGFVNCFFVRQHCAAAGISLAAANPQAHISW